jgi:hypothetical protein
MWCSKERLENFKCHFYQTSNKKRTETVDRSASPESTFSMQRKYGYFGLGFFYYHAPYRVRSLASSLIILFTL